MPDPSSQSAPGEPADAAMVPTPDALALKRASRQQWDEAARGWNAHTAQIGAWLSRATEAMIEMAGITRNARVLDVAAGAGDQTLAIAERVGPRGFVLATDLSPAILALAQDNARDAGHANVETRVADGENLQLDPQSFDAAVCRLGLMLFPQPLQGLREMQQALKPGARACTLVFSGPEHNPCITTLLSTALKHAGLASRQAPQPGSLLSLGQPGLMDRLFEAAGFSEVATTAIDAPFRLPSARHYLDFIRSSASPIQQILAKLDVCAAAAAWDEMEERLAPYTTATGWEGPNELLLTAGRR
ncbi:MAG: class I SAM-dependent methyltransferase [Burkholderiaceae bacterium]